ncbi:MAG TPA: glycosyltransferase family 4 protein [Candidatus Dormibacteraeota bacterium]|nr:glycosyltransferase family 4 protein [Candidatus Dormibacteraeota bacterium]
MKVGLVSPYDYLRPGGVGEHVRHLASELGRQGHEVRILAPSAGGREKVVEGVIPLGRPIPIPANGSVARISLSFHLSRKIREILEAERFDVVHLHEPLMPALPVTVLRTNREGVNVGTFHAYARQNLGYYYGRPLLRRLFRRLDGCIAVSEPAKTFVSRYFPADYTVIPNGIDPEIFNPSVPPAPGIPSPTRQTILFLGRLEERKGLGTLLDAYSLLRQVRADCQLVVVGNGPLRRGYQRRVEEEGVPDVNFCGFIPEADKASYFTAADIYCAPNTGKESFGVILLEAMASGRPVVATAIDGFRQVISDGVEGLLTPPGDEAQMAATLARLLDDRGLRQQMGERGRRAAEGYAWPLVADRVLSVYESALRARRQPEVRSFVQPSAASVR